MSRTESYRLIARADQVKVIENKEYTLKIDTVTCFRYAQSTSESEAYTTIAWLPESEHSLLPWRHSLEALIMFIPSGYFVDWTARLLIIVLSVVGSVCFLWLVSIVIKRVWPSKSYWIAIIGLALLNPLPFLLGDMALRYLNMSLDTKPVSIHKLAVLQEVNQKRGKDYILVQHWIPGEKPLEIEFPYYKKGTILDIVVHQGNLGLTWIETPADVSWNEMKRSK